MRYFIVFLVSSLLLASCENDSKKRDIENIPMTVEVKRFDKIFAEASPENIPELKQEFPYLFPPQFHDSIWVQKMQDTLQLELEQEVFKVYPDFSHQEKDIKKLFQHLKYYFPDFKSPTIITLISDVDYRNRVIAVDSLLFIGLDNFLGSDHHFYGGIQKYLSKNFTPEQLVPKIAETYAQQLIVPSSERTFLSGMIYYGKILYLKELLLPKNEPHEIMGYTPEEMQWSRANETEIWRYFIERELLYSTDSKLPNRFLNPAPFSKFYLELDNESPGRLGQYMGWQIVKAYAQNTDATIDQIIAAKAEDIFKQSKYKPRK